MSMKRLIEDVEQEFLAGEQDSLEEWGKATHYMKVKNPKTGNMNKIGFADSGLAVSGDPDLVKSINAKRSGGMKGDRKAVGMIKKYNQRVDREGGSYDTKAFNTKQIAGNLKNSHSTAGDMAHRNAKADPKNAGKAAAAGVTGAAEDAIKNLMAKKKQIKSLHGAKQGEKGALSRLARKVKTFFKPKTLDDKDI